MKILFPVKSQTGIVRMSSDRIELRDYLIPIPQRHQFELHLFWRNILNSIIHNLPYDELMENRPRKILPDPAFIREIILRHRWLFLGTFLAVVLLAGGVLWITPKVYSATATLQLEPREGQPVKVNDRGALAPADDNLIDTAVMMMRSPALTIAVVRRLHLDRRKGFGLPEKPGTADGPIGGGTQGAATLAEERAMLRVLALTKVRRIGVTYLVDVTARTGNPELSAELANGIAQTYIALSAQHRQSRSRQSAEDAQARAETLRRQAVADDATLQDYMVRHNLMSAEGATMAEQEVSELNRQIAEAQAALAEQRGRLAAAQSQLARGGGGADIGAALASDTVRQLRQQEAQASARLAQLDARYGNRHPDVIEARNELDDIHAQLQAELSRIVSGLRADVQIAQSRLDSLLASRGGARGSLAQNSAAQVGRLELERRAEASRAIYNAFLTRAKEAAQAGSLADAEASIASSAQVPGGPISPNRKLGALAGLFVALAAGLAATGIAEYAESRVSTRRDIEQALGASYIGAIPTLHSAARVKRGSIAPQDYVVSRPFSMFTESLRHLASGLDLLGADGKRVVTITSPLPREGKSTTAMCLARTLALSHRTVVLVDADLRHHSTSDALVPGREGEALLRVLDGTLPIDEALTRDTASGLVVLTTRGEMGGGEGISRESMMRLIEALKARFDIVIFDSAPLLGLAETRIVTRLSDTTLVVARWRRTPLRAVETTLELLRQSGSTIAGIALSFLDARQYASAGLGDAFGYHKKFKGYYVD
ncbi:protein-tyrosine kinase [Sphingomonas sp. IC081]|nr:protein-tyrosine kinase [Sphingomonas sp. IC081]